MEEAERVPLSCKVNWFGMCAVWFDVRDGQKIDGKTKLKMNPSWADAGFN